MSDTSATFRLYDTTVLIDLINKTNNKACINMFTTNSEQLNSLILMNLLV